MARAAKYRVTITASLLASAFILPRAGIAQDASEIRKEPVGLEIAYLMSFPEFDSCGDSEAGRISRKAIIEKFRSCPYSAEAREKFEDNIRSNLEDMTSDLWSGASQGLKPKGPPEVEDSKIDPSKKPLTCTDYRKTALYAERRDRLMRYAKGEIGVDEALGESDCPSGPASL